MLAGKVPDAAQGEAVSVFRQWFLYCDGGKECPSDGDCAFPSSLDEPREQRRIAALTMGWVRRKVRGKWLDLCPQCKARPEFKRSDAKP